MTAGSLFDMSSCLPYSIPIRNIQVGLLLSKSNSIPCGNPKLSRSPEPESAKA